MSLGTSDNKKLTVKDYHDLSARVENLAKDNKELNEKLKSYEDIGANIVSSETGYTHKPISRMSSEEFITLKAFNCSSVKELLETNTAATAFKHIPAQYKYQAVQLKKEFAICRAIAQLLFGGRLDNPSISLDSKTKVKNVEVKEIYDTYFYKNILAPKLKAFGTSVVGGGSEWIPTAISEQFIAEFELERELIGALKQIALPTKSYELPVATALTKARRGTEGVSATTSQFTTGKITFVSRKFLEYYEFPEELDEDSAHGIIEFGQSELTEAHLRAYESTTVNGTLFGTTHIDSDTEAGSADLAEKNFHGLRKLALDNTANGATVDFGNAVVSNANLRLMRQRLKNLGVNPLNCLWIPGSTAYLQMLGTENVVTVDKMGAAATILKGQLGALDGIPIIQTGFMRDDLNAAGVHDGVTTDRTGLLLIHRNRWYWGVRRPIKMAVRPSKSKDDQFEMASYSRVDFKGHTQSATEIGVVYGVNIPS